MKTCHIPILLAAFALAGCASNLQPPEIPEYHPASPHASQAPRIQAFDVLTVTATSPPELPVPEGMQRPAKDPEMNDMQHGGMDHGSMPMQAPSGTVEHEAQTPRQGQMPEDHPPLQDGQHRHEIDDDIKRGEAPMQDKIVVPREQRGMNADSTLYHEHKNDDSTHIRHPNRSQDSSISGKHVWLCPMHPKFAVATPGGRCPECDTVLVPVRVVER
jgi:hypothetical protein